MPEGSNIVGSLFVNISATTEGLEKSLNNAASTIQRTSRKLQSSGAALTKSLTLPIAAAGAAAIKFGGDFDDAMTQSLAIMTDVSDAMRRDMVNAAKDVSKVTTFSARDAAQAYFFLASAGLDAASSIKALPAVAQFAQAGMFDMARATDLLTDAQSALGLTVRNDAIANMENMVRVSDVLVKANTLANASVEQFSESLTNKAGAALRIVNKSVEEGVAVLAAFADQGVKGSEAGTQLSIVMRDLQTKAISNKDAFRSLGVTVFNDVTGNMENLGDIIGDLERGLAGMSDETAKATLLNLGFADKSVAAIQTLLGMSGAIKDYEFNLNRAGGTTAQVSSKQMESFKAQLALLRNALERVGIALFEAIAPALRTVVIPALNRAAEVVEGVIAAFQKLPAPIKAAGLSLVAMAAAIGPVLIGAGVAGGGLAALLRGLSSLTALSRGAATAIYTRLIPAIAGIRLATGLTVGAIGLIVTALALWVSKSEEALMAEAMEEAALVRLRGMMRSTRLTRLDLIEATEGMIGAEHRMEEAIVASQLALAARPPVAEIVRRQGERVDLVIASEREMLERVAKINKDFRDVELLAEDAQSKRIIRIWLQSVEMERATRKDQMDEWKADRVRVAEEIAAAEVAAQEAQFKAAEDARKAYEDTFNRVRASSARMWEDVLKVGQSSAITIGNVFKNAFNSAAVTILSTLEAALVSPFVHAFETAIKRLANRLVDILVNPVIDALGGVISGIFGGGGKALVSALPGLSSTTVSAVQTARGVAGGAGTAATSVTGGLLSSLSGIGGILAGVGGIANLISGLGGSKFEGIVSGGVDHIKNTLNTYVETWFRSIAPNIFNGLNSINIHSARSAALLTELLSLLKTTPASGGGTQPTLTLQIDGRELARIQLPYTHDLVKFERYPLAATELIG